MAKEVDKGKCVFCLSTCQDEQLVGKKYQLDDIIAHNYCLLFACAIIQRGDDDEGINGFLKDDILREVKRAKRLRCVFCGHSGAASACCIKSCRVTYHYLCGIKNAILSQFFGSFNSFCMKHRPLQVLTRRFIQDRVDEDCPICMRKISPEKDRRGLYYLKTPCCQALIHRECIQKHAHNAGYFFKCPMCNNVQEFLREMQEFGIYIPEQDASWELEEHAFEDLYTPYNRCDVANCLCPNGRDFDKEGTDWDIAVCNSCASHGSHVKCSNIPDDLLQAWVCSICTVVENKGENSRKRKISDENTASCSQDDQIMSVNSKRIASDVPSYPRRLSPRRPFLTSN